MAKIYPKPISGGLFDNTLILDSREALVLPFDFSGQFTSIKMVAFASWTSGTQDNANMLSVSAFNTDLPSNENVRNKHYFGFMTHDGFPGESGCAFIGATLGSGDANNRLRLGGLNDPILWGGSNFGGSTTLGLVNPTGGVEQSVANKMRFQFSWPEFHTGDSAYVSIMGVEVNFSNVGSSNALVTMYKFNDNINRAPSTGYADIVSAAFPSAYNDSNGATYTAAYQFSGVPLILPKYGFIYNPFAEFKLRIHGVAIFKS